MTVHSHERGTPCTLICTANGLEQGDLEPERAVTQQTRSEGGTMLASPGGRCLLSLEGLLAGCPAAFVAVAD